MHVIAYKGKLYAFETKENDIESEVSISRFWFIVKNIDKFDDYKYLETLSHIWSNCKYLKVTYDDNVMKELALCNDP
jgi:hypothetical protein